MYAICDQDSRNEDAFDEEEQNSGKMLNISELFDRIIQFRGDMVFCNIFFIIFFNTI